MNLCYFLFIFLLFFFMQKPLGLQKICCNLYSNMFALFVHLLCLKVHVFFSQNPNETMLSFFFIWRYLFFLKTLMIVYAGYDALVFRCRHKENSYLIWVWRLTRRQNKWLGRLLETMIMTIHLFMFHVLPTSLQLIPYILLIFLVPLYDYFLFVYL